ncbi:MAG: hypothetical protein NDF57_06930 [archaeon GBS-70-058]|nr:hypothetical protein [Candidatus Culexarchaeum nevadense]
MRVLHRNVALHILKLTKDRPFCSVEEIVESSFVSLASLMDVLKDLEMHGFIKLIDVDGFLNVNVPDRFRLAYYLIDLGTDVERVSKFLSWREFEVLCSDVLKLFEFHVDRNVKFKYGSKRFEIDVIGYKFPYIICLDCKHWSEGRLSAIKASLENHYRKTSIFSLHFLSRSSVNYPRGELIFIPVVVTLLDYVAGVYDGLPIVSIFKFNSFINDLPMLISSLKVIRVHC